MIHLDTVLNKLFEGYLPSVHKSARSLSLLRTLDAEMLVADFNRQFGVSLDEEDKTLGALVQEKLGHIPKEGESVEIASFIFRVKEVTLFGVKTVIVKSLQE